MQDDQTRLPEDSNHSAALNAGQDFGQYKVLRLLGRGGMGEVYEVEHPVLKKRYALKLVNEEIMSRPEAVQRFQREAQVMANLEHPNIVKVDDFGETDGRTWLRMELVGGGAAERAESGDLRPEEGGSLADLLSSEPLAESLVVELLKKILNGLSYAHEQGVVHRDLKPSNILLQSSENLCVHLASLSGKKIIPKITDFGLVRLAGEQWLQSQVQLTVARSIADPDKTHLDNEHSGSGGTSTQALLGTFEFMSPEQKEGLEAGPASDLFSLGLIAFRMLTGQKSPGFEMPSEIVSGLNPAWDGWMKKALAQDVGRRFASAAEMMKALPDGKPSMADGGSRIAEEKKSKKGLWLGMAALLVVAAVLGVGYFLTTTSIELSPGKETEPRRQGSEDLTTEDTESTEEKTSGLQAPHSPLFTLTVEPSDAEARVWLGERTNVPVEGGELSLEGLPEGEHELIVQAAGYEPFSTRVTVGAGGAGEQVVRLVPVKGRLRVSADPGTSITAVSSSGREIALGKTDTSGELLVDRLLTVGTYNLRLEKAKHESEVLEDVELILGREVRAEADLQPLPGKLNVFTVPQGAMITVNGKELGTSSTTLEDVPTEVPLVVEVHKPGYRREKEELTLEAAGSRSLNFGTLTAESGNLLVAMLNEEVLRWKELKFFINDRPIERTTGGKFFIKYNLLGFEFANVELGEANLRIEHPDYETWTGAVTVYENDYVNDPGGAKIVDVKLQPKPGVLELAVSPAGVSYSLKVGGKTADRISADRYRVPAEAKLELKVSAKGYKSVALEGTVPPNGSATVSVTLKQIPARMRGEGLRVNLGGGQMMEFVWIPEVYSWVGKYEVTNGQYRCFKSLHHSRQSKGHDLNAERQPVVKVSYEDAVAYANWLNKRLKADGYEVHARLLTGDEWTMIARCGTNRKYPWGDSWPPKYGNYHGQEGVGREGASVWSKIEGYNDGYAVSAPVEKSGRNEWGLYGVGGNVSEWTTDKAGTSGVLRGESWIGVARNRLKVEFYEYKSYFPSYGFRLLLSEAGE